VAKELPFQQGLVERCAVHLDQGLARTQPGIVHGLGHQFLAGTAFPANDHRRIGLGGVPDYHVHPQHGRRAANEAVVVLQGNGV